MLNSRGMIFKHWPFLTPTNRLKRAGDFQPFLWGFEMFWGIQIPNIQKASKFPPLMWPEDLEAPGAFLLRSLLFLRQKYCCNMLKPNVRWEKQESYFTESVPIVFWARENDLYQDSSTEAPFPVSSVSSQLALVLVLLRLMEVKTKAKQFLLNLSLLFN